MSTAAATDLRTIESVYADPIHSGLEPAEVEVALLCVDVVGFTPMTELLGDRRSLSVMRRVAGLISQQARRSGGAELEVRGDSFLLAFAGARDALSCAAGIQASLARDAEAHPREGVRVRSAIHVGTVLQQGGGYFGRNMILPFRVLSVTGAGQIAVTSAARRQLPRGWQVFQQSEQSFLPKGFKHEVEFSLVDWPENAPPANDPTPCRWEHPEREMMGAPA